VLVPLQYQGSVGEIAPADRQDGYDLKGRPQYYLFHVPEGDVKGDHFALILPIILDPERNLDMVRVQFDRRTAYCVVGMQWSTEQNDESAPPYPCKQFANESARSLFGGGAIMLTFNLLLRGCAIYTDHVWQPKYPGANVLKRCPYGGPNPIDIHLTQKS